MNRLEEAADNLLAWSSDRPEPPVAAIARRANRNRRRRRAVLCAAVAAPIALGGALFLAIDDNGTSVVTNPAPPATAPATSEVTVPTTSTAPTTPTPTTSTPVTTPATSAPTTTTAPSALGRFPKDRKDITQGGTTWAVLMVGSTDVNDPVITDAIAVAERAGYSTGVAECDQGATEALGGPPGNFYYVSIYFYTQADADAALAAFHATGFSGGVVAEVVTYCLD